MTFSNADPDFVLGEVKTMEQEEEGKQQPKAFTIEWLKYMLKAEMALQKALKEIEKIRSQHEG